MSDSSPLTPEQLYAQQAAQQPGSPQAAPPYPAQPQAYAQPPFAPNPYAQQPFSQQQQDAQQQQQFALMQQAQWQHQQTAQQAFWAQQQQRLYAQRMWMDSTRGVGLVLGLGLFVLAFMRFLMMPLMWGGSMVMFDLVIRAPLLGAALGGVLMAVGWLVILSRQPQPKQRAVAVIGMLSSVGLAVSGAVGLMAPDVLHALMSGSTPWLELLTLGMALVGATMWRSGPVQGAVTVGWVGLALMLMLTLLTGAFGGATIGFGILPIATWATVGSAVLGMRALRPDLAPGVPNARVVQR